MATRRVLVDVHTHVYTPTYLQLLRQRNEPPQVLPVKGSNGDSADEKAGKAGRLVILPGGDEGRPVNSQYWDKAEKVRFMDEHEIDASVISLANPWLDFLPIEQAAQAAHQLNQELNEYCIVPTQSSSSFFEPALSQRFLAFGVLPIVFTSDSPDTVIKAAVDSVDHIKSLPNLRGVILGTRGVGKGLDDPRLDPVWTALDEAGLVVFLHPHYGITLAKGSQSEFGELENGHVLPLALGFPMETTIAVSRLILAGVLDRFPSLKLLLAHSAGALPVLSSRLASCVAHDPHVRDRLEDDVRAYLGRLYYDAIAYGPEELAFLERCIARADAYEGPDDALPYTERVTSRAERRDQGPSRIGTRRILFGTDHPFFPPAEALDEDGRPARWRSVDENVDAIEFVQGWSDEDRDRVCSENAAELFGFET